MILPHLVFPDRNYQEREGEGQSYPAFQCAYVPWIMYISGIAKLEHTKIGILIGCSEKSICPVGDIFI